MICYLQKELKSFIKSKMEEQGQESINFKKIMQKTINIKAKAGLRLNIIV